MKFKLNSTLNHSNIHGLAHICSLLEGLMKVTSAWSDRRFTEVIYPIKGSKPSLDYFSMRCGRTTWDV